MQRAMNPMTGMLPHWQVMIDAIEATAKVLIESSAARTVATVGRSRRSSRALCPPPHHTVVMRVQGGTASKPRRAEASY